MALTTTAGAAPATLRWNGSAAGTNAWDSSSTNWLDAGNNPVAWQSGAEAQFDGQGEAVTVAEAVAASNLTFVTGGYTVSGTGLLSVAGTLSAAASAENTIAAELRAGAALTKAGAGKITLTHPNASLTNALFVSAGTLGLSDAAIPGALSVSNGATLAALPSSATGLMGFYYSVAPNSANFASLSALEAHLGYLTPDCVALSSGAGSTFDFGTSGSLFPLPYGLGGSRTNNFEAVWRGTITIPTNTYYTFRLTHDDGFILGIDNRMVLNSLANTTTEGTINLDAGEHDIVLGFYQTTGAYGLKIEVKALYGSYAALPTSWLKPYTSIGALSGSGSASLSASGSSLRANPNISAAFAGSLAGPAGSLFTKGGWGPLALGSSGATSNALAGGVAVQGGSLAIAASERIGDASTARIGDSSALVLAASETLGALAGQGTVILGNTAPIRVVSFTSDADSGISTNKTYTHLLDFPNNGNPATVNGVTFTSAGSSGSTNGYSWNISNPPTLITSDNTNDVFYSGISRLTWDFYYNSSDYTITLSGLTPYKTYEARLYFRSYGSVNPVSPRKVTFFCATGAAFLGSIYYSPDAQYALSWLSCRYAADASGTLSIRALAHNSGHTCHLYGLSNEETTAPVAPPPAAGSYPRVVAFTNDTDSGLSADKTYTHKLDFPTNGGPATVNGVTFTAAGMSGSADGYGWNTTGIVPTGWWNSAPDDNTRSGVDRLLWDFAYGSTNFTLNLTGLVPFRTYETRLYFRSFGNAVSDSLRDIIATFAAGSTLVGSVSHDLETMTRSRIECRYTADASGALAINIVSLSSGNTCHLYGLSNEEVNQPASLTLNAPAGATVHHTGAILGAGALTKRGAGTQCVGGPNTLSTALDVQEGTLAFEPGASVLSGVVVRAGATAAAPSGNVWLGGLSGAGTFNLAGLTPYSVTNLIAFTVFTNDLTTGISTSKTYTHLLDFGIRANVAVINGVTFTKVAAQDGASNGFGWSNFPPTTHSGNAPPAGHSVPEGSGAYDLLYDMDYGWSWPDGKTMQLTGLTPGKRYEVRLYNRAWGWTGLRTQTITFDPDGTGPVSESVTFNPDALDANYLSYRYTPTSTTLDITVQSAYSNQTYHLYGLSNEEASDATYTPVTVNIAQDSTFAGAVTGAGAWTKTGTGTLTLTATNSATGALAVDAGTLAVANGGTATLGPVSVANGASLVGVGSSGGDVTVASNATLRAGTSAVCGTLAIGGNLTLSPGARPRWRYASGSADVITVGGRLSLPTNGTLYAQTLTPGLHPPEIAPVFVSSQTIEGPADLSGWSVEGIENARLLYNASHTVIRFYIPSGTVVLIR